MLAKSKKLKIPQRPTHRGNNYQKFNPVPLLSVVNYNAPTTYFYQTITENQTMPSNPQISPDSNQKQQQQIMTSFAQQSMVSYQQQTNFNFNVYPNAPIERNPYTCRPPYTNSSASSEYEYQPPPEIFESTTKSQKDSSSQDLIDFDREVNGTSNVPDKSKLSADMVVYDEGSFHFDSAFNYSTSSFKMQDSVSHSNLQVEEIQKQLSVIDLKSKIFMKDDSRFLSNKSANNPFIDRCSSGPFDHIAEDDIIFSLDHPPFAGADFKIPDNKIHCKVGDEFGIFISEIHSPSQFWYHDGDQKFILDYLMDDLENYYRDLTPNDLKFHESRMSVGHVCAAKYCDSWHRGEILASPKNGLVRIFFLDYGTRTDINVNDVKFLLTEIAKTPRQAYRGCLHGIQPADKSLFWELDATKEMLNYVSFKPLTVLCRRFKETENVALLSVILTKEEININRLLIFKGYATQASEVMTINGEEIFGIGPKCYEYPDFETLEKTDYPSYGQRVVLKMKYDINFNVIEDTYNLMNSYDDVLKRDDVLKAMTLDLTHIPIIEKVKKFFLYKQQQPDKKIFSE